MSISVAHSQAARVNGALSQGPVTAEGKSAASQNSRKHGILTSIALLPHEDQNEFTALLNSFVNEHQPTSPTELTYIREMADADWRLTRIRNYSLALQLKQMATLDNPNSAAAATEAFLQLTESAEKSLNTLLRYEAHFRRQFDRSLNQLLKMRSTHQAIETKTAASFQKFTADFINAPTPGEQAAAEPSPVPESQELRNEPKPPAAPSAPPPPISRKAPCPCGSGKVFKRCCGHYAPPIIHSKAA